MNHENFNPFTRIYEQLNRIESMIAELIKQHESKRGDDNNGIELAMKVTGYKRNTIYKLVNLRQIPHYKQRGFLRFDEKELMKWRMGKNRPYYGEQGSC